MAKPRISSALIEKHPAAIKFEIDEKKYDETMTKIVELGLGEPSKIEEIINQAENKIPDRLQRDVFSLRKAIYHDRNACKILTKLGSEKGNFVLAGLLNYLLQHPEFYQEKPQESL